MRVLAGIVMVLGLVMMSAPFVLPRLGIMPAAWVPQSPPAHPAEGPGPLAGLAKLAQKGVETASSYLGIASADAAPVGNDAAAASLSARDGAPETSPQAEGQAPAVSIIQTSARPSGGGAKFVRAREIAPEAATP